MRACVRACVRVCVCKLRKLLVCLLCNFCIFNNCSLSVKIYNKCVILYCDVVNVQPCFNIFDEIIILNLQYIYEIVSKVMVQCTQSIKLIIN